VVGVQGPFSRFPGTAATVFGMTSQAHDNDHEDIHDRGLQFDLGTLARRRSVLTLFAGGALTALAGCAASETTGSTSTTSASTTSGGSSTTSSAGTAASCEEIPEETAGPYPGDGSNGPDILTESGIVRSDITSSIGSASGVAEGVPLTITLTLQDAGGSCAALAGAAVYLWHCDREGRYSMYSNGVDDENYLRGVQEADADGRVTFTSIFPGAYSGRWPHVHFEVYSSLADATSLGPIKATSQLALPEDVCAQVYETDGYSQSIRNLQSTSLERDNVFRDDGGARQLATVTGSVDGGLTASLVVPV
jgi:protocatechuate 3,4-dioxygenase beta subunit